MKINRVKSFQTAVIMAIAAVIVAAMVVAAPIAFGQSTDDSSNKARHRRGGHSFKHRGHRMAAGRAFRGIDLTEEQKAQIKQIRASHNESTKALRQQIRAEMQSLRESRQAGTFDESLVSQKLAAIAPLRAKLMGEQFRIHQEMLAVLTPEQKAKIDEMREKAKARGEERRARRNRK